MAIHGWTLNQLWPIVVSKTEYVVTAFTIGILLLLFVYSYTHMFTDVHCSIVNLKSVPADWQDILAANDTYDSYS